MIHIPAKDLAPRADVAPTSPIPGADTLEGLGQGVKVPLPPSPEPPLEVEMSEDVEETVFKENVRLYRFDGSTNEWKERGTGSIRLLQNKSKKHKARVVMWRAGTQKLACNHWLQRGMKIDYHRPSFTALIWTALDFAEDKNIPQAFSCRFTNLQMVGYEDMHGHSIGTIV